MYGWIWDKSFAIPCHRNIFEVDSRVNAGDKDFRGWSKQGILQASKVHAIQKLFSSINNHFMSYLLHSGLSFNKIL